MQTSRPLKQLAWRRHGNQNLARALTLVLICANAPIYAQTASNDPLTGIPVFPSAAGGDENYPGGICRVKAQTAVYTVKFLWGPNHTAAPQQTQVLDVERWYQAHLKDYKFILGFDGQRTQDAFLSPDGTKAVTVTGNPNHSPVTFGISFTLFASPVQPGQVKSFASHQNIQC
jgi:hypothetical protein